MWIPRSLARSIYAAIFLIVFAQPAITDEPAKPKRAQTPEQAIEFLAAASKAGNAQAALDQIAHPFHDMMLWVILQEEAEDVLSSALDQKFGQQKRKGFRMEVKQDLLRIQKIEILAKDKGSDTKVKVSVRETAKSFQRDGNDIIETSYLAVKDGESWKLLRPFTALIFSASEEDMTQKVAPGKGSDGKEIKVFQITFKKELDELGRIMWKSVEEKEEETFPKLLDLAKREKAVAEKVAADIKGGTYTTRKQATDAFEVLRQAVKKSR